jgi:heme exporter protein D
MSGLTEFVAMGGHGAFVWPAYAIAAIVLFGVLGASWTQLRRVRDRLRRMDGETGGERQ